nr:hypothetical protein [Tanacetum cinerariifolium]
LYDVRPLEDDLIRHLYFIGEAVKRDETLQKSKFLASFLEGKRRKKKAFDPFLMDDVKDTNELTTKEAIYNESESKDEDDMNDTICAICNNGGDLTYCDGKCFRAFHATVESAEAAAESKCISLGLPAEKVKGSQPFVCLNCTHEIHQCFACGELGSSNKSSGAEVFCCCSKTCGHFYHPKCVAKLIQDESDTKTQLIEEKIADGGSFICPIHKCHKFKQEENKKAFDLPVENPEILSEKAIGQTIEKAENQKIQGPLLSDEHVEAYDLHVKKCEILSEKDTSQTTDEVINCKSSKNIVVAQHQGPVSKVQEPLLSKIVEAFDLPVEKPEILSEKDTSQTTDEVINCLTIKTMWKLVFDDQEE